MPTAPPLTDEAAPAPAAAVDEALVRIKEKLVRPMPTDQLLGWVLPIVLMILAGIARFWRLTRPGGPTLHNKNGLVFDEVYYAHDSWGLLHHGVETNAPGTGAGFVVHPPLGKWMMAIGEAIFDHGKQVTITSKSAGVVTHTIYPASTFSFRFMGAVVGTLAILIVARLGRRMFRSTGLGLVAGALVALDGLEFVQSRTAMLDIYLMFWVLAAFACLVVDRDDGRQRLAARLSAPIAPDSWGPRLGFRRWRWASAFCIGCACSTKWDGAFYLPALIILMIAWDIGARRTAGSRTGVPRQLVYAGLPIVTVMVVVPAMVYVASWTGWFLSNAQYAYYHDQYVHPGQSWLAHDWAVFHGWWYYQRAIWHYSNTLTWDNNPHPYLSRPWGWLLMTRPVAYYYQSPSGCGAVTCSQEVLGIGNPALWWASIPALLAVVWVWLSKRDWRAGAIVLMFLFGYLPWIREDASHRVMFFFYMLPNVPIMALAVTLVIGLALGDRASRAVMSVRRTISTSIVAVYLVTVVVLFGFFYPVLAAQTITYSQWHDRIWFRQCQAHPDTHEENAPCWI